MAASALGTLVACSDDEPASSSSSSSGSSGDPADDTVTVRVPAATGGTVEDKQGRAKLSIPAGALAQDTDITLKISPKTGNAVADVADFGPDGLQFLKPATLELKADPAAAPAGKSLAVGIEEGGTFKEIAGSTFANGIAKADVAHFTKFSVIVVDGKITLVDPASCQDARAKFVPCGGDPSGTWLFADYCPDPAMFSGNDPFKGACAQYSLAVEFTNTQEVIIDASTLSLSAGQTSTTLTQSFPLSCAQSDGGGPAACADIPSQGSQTVCTDKGGGQCECTQSQTQQVPAESPKPYTTNGSVWTSQGGSSGEYCVSGDILYYREIKDGGAGLLYVLKRK